MNLLILSIGLLVIMGVSYFRFRVGLNFNKFLLLGSALIVALLLTYSLGSEGAAWGLYFFVLISSYSFSWIGGGAAALVSTLITVAIEPTTDLSLWFGYWILGIAGGSLFGFYGKIIRQHRAAQVLLNRQSKQWMIAQNISIALQSTMDLSKLLHIILTAITAGYGLGFNRALLFFMEEEKHQLRGQVGIGSMNEHEGLSIWKSVVDRKITLNDFIAMGNEARIKDFRLNDLLRELVVPLDGTQHVILRALQDKRPYIVYEIDEQDPVQLMLREVFQMSSFAVIPLINQNKRVGVIIVDNNINHLPLNSEEVDSIIPLAAQASIAIENARLYEKAQQMSVTDGLTGLYNQRYFHTSIHELVDEANRSGQDLAVVIGDIDFFKHYNDTNGHLEGNQLLIRLSQLIKDQTSDAHIPCRFGGEEFVILLPGEKEAEALAVAERVRAAVEQADFRNRESQPGGKVTISFGVATYQAGLSAQQLLNKADMALYIAKRSGKNQVQLYQEGANAQ